MKFQKKVLTFGIIVAMVCACAFTASAKGFRGGGPGMGFGGLIKSLDLTDAQKKGIAEVLVKYRDEIKTATDKLMTAHENLFVVILADVMIETDVRQTSQEIASIKEDMNVLKAQAVSEIRPLLTSEQIEQLKTKKGGRQEKMKERRQKMGERFDKILEEWLALEVE